MNPDDVCYRHPGRRSFVLCQRCARTICPECQVQAPVGVHCVECAREAAEQHRAAAAAAFQANPRAYEPASGVGRWLEPFKTASGVLIGLTTAVGLAQWLIPGLWLVLAFFEPYAAAEPWRFLTGLFVHSGPLHFAFNMLALYFLGPPIEQRLGRGMFVASYVIAGIAGFVAAGFLAPGNAVIGASGAIFGLLGMYVALQKHIGRISPTLLIIIGLNLAIGFILGGISWQAHVGGLIAGLGLGYAVVQGLKAGRRAVSWRWIGVVAAVVAALAVLMLIVR